MHGALLVDKPCGPTSHDVVAVARRALKTRGIGHTGTLDPLATGLLVLLVGHATRLARFLVTDEKEYIADIRLGISTPTYDAQSLEEAFRLKAEATSAESFAGPTGSESAADARPADPRGFRLKAEELDRVLETFLGTYPQLPPPFSAKKVDGVRAYKKARNNEPVDLKPVEVTVRELELVPQDTDPLLLRLRIVCTAGFYVRSLAQDIGQLLGCGAHLEALRRTRAGQFHLADAVTLGVLQAADSGLDGRLIGLNALLADLPAVTPTEEGLRRAWNGNTLAPAHLAAGLDGMGAARIRVLNADGEVLSVAERRADGLLHPLLVLR
ncbi:MAG TPA: tRNA pseudouridine(55) synthase TruB [Vicinamibacterales bacterium]|nr:tRNA pseudouridine(55) synthase TruB [Vicinamibacterales bacterium]